MLDQNKVTALLQKGSLSYEIQCVESIDSTNAQLRRQAMDGEAVRSCGCMVCAAEHQTSGRGRRGRRWESPSGKNLYFSLLLFPEFAQEKASMLTLVAALAVT